MTVGNHQFVPNCPLQAYLTKAMELVADTLSNAAAVHAQPSFGGSQAGMSVGGASSPSSVRGSEVGESIKGLPSAPQHTVHPQVCRAVPQSLLILTGNGSESTARAACV